MFLFFFFLAEPLPFWVNPGGLPASQAPGGSRGIRWWMVTSGRPLRWQASVRAAGRTVTSPRRAWLSVLTGCLPVLPADETRGLERPGPPPTVRALAVQLCPRPLEMQRGGRRAPPTPRNGLGDTGQGPGQVRTSIGRAGRGHSHLERLGQRLLAWLPSSRPRGAPCC